MTRIPNKSLPSLNINTIIVYYSSFFCPLLLNFIVLPTIFFYINFYYHYHHYHYLLIPLYHHCYYCIFAIASVFFTWGRPELTLGTNSECPYSMGLRLINMTWWSSPHEADEGTLWFGQSSNNACSNQMTLMHLLFKANLFLKR